MLRSDRDVEVAHTARHAGSAAVDCSLQRRGVRRQEVGGCEGPDDRLGGEAHPPLVPQLELSVLDQRIDGLARAQVRLHQAPKQPALLPSGIGETPIGAVRLDVVFPGRNAGNVAAELAEPAHHVPGAAREGAAEAQDRPRRKEALTRAGYRVGEQNVQGRADLTRHALASGAVSSCSGGHGRTCSSVLVLSCCQVVLHPPPPGSP
jgi:hypothetical protein